MSPTDQRTYHAGSQVSNRAEAFAGHKISCKPTGSHAN
jgi:hypothetical protein